MAERKLKFTIPKGSLWKICSELMTEAGYDIGGSSRNYRPTVNDEELEIKLLRPQEIPEYLEDGQFDLGISGRDWVKETRTNVVEVLDLEMGGVKIVFAIPNTWDQSIKSFNDFLKVFIEKDQVLRISTEYINLITDFITECPAYKEAFGDSKPWVYTPWNSWGDNRKVRIYLSFGATEAKPPEEVDCIFDNTATGSTMRANNLRMVETIDTSTALLLASPQAMKDEFKKEKINDIKLLLKGVIEGKNKFHVFMNCKEENVEKICSLLPALKQPTIGKLHGNPGWVAINTIIDRGDFLPLIPKIKKLAQGLVVLKPKQVIEIL